MPLPSAPAFTSRVPLQFICPDNTALSITGATSLFNNCQMFKINTGTVAKIEMGLNGNTFFRGDGEFAPFAIDMEWKVLGYTDYQALAALRPYFIHLVTFRNIGYYGKLIMDGPTSNPNSADLVSTKATFYPLTPSDQGGALAVSRLATPTTLANALGASGSGSIPASSTIYYWMTFSTIWGETPPQEITTVTGAFLSCNTLTFSFPSNPSCIKASIYSSLTNDPTTSKLVGELLNGDTAQWTDYVGPAGLIIPQTPPTVNTAYRGTWQNAIWANETP